MSKYKDCKKKTKKAKESGKVYRGFFAFPSEPDDRKGIIEKAISLVNDKKTEHGFEIKSWTKMDKSSARIISNIIESIIESDIVIADITGLNPNVLFEVGFAFGAGKKILLFVQGFSSVEKDKDISDLEIISGLEIDSYQNSQQIATKILSNVPGIFNRDAEIYKYGYNPKASKKSNDRGFFMKGLTDHPFAATSLAAFRLFFSSIAIDDWNEDMSQNLMFYIKEVEKSLGVVALFVNPAWDYGRKVNARFSFICGMAVAMGKNVLMIGLPGFQTPFDYKEIMIKPKDDDSVRNRVIDKFNLHEENPTVNLISPSVEIEKPENIKSNSDVDNKDEQDSVISEQLKVKEKNELTKEDKEIILIDINIGNPIAENEELELAEYFVKTGQYSQALNAKQAIIVGNKGSGKTACFYQIRDYYKMSSKKNLVCEIKPSDYRMERFLGSLKRLEEGKGLVGHVLENVWKTIVYCSILETIYRELDNRSSYTSLPREEQLLMDFVNKHIDLVTCPFEQKLEKACDWLGEIDYNIDNFSQKIHSEFLSDAKAVLIPVLRSRDKIVILLDNLDKAWQVNSDLYLQAQLFFNLLGIHRRLYTDFGIKDVSVLIFIRRNIFEYILNNVARESDKLSAETIELQWNDKDILLRVLEERFRITTNYWKREVNNPWDTFFKWENNDVSIKDWIYNSVLPRPRDLIRFIQKAIEIAISREHSEIQEDDLVKALKSYSAFALEQIIAEYKAEEPWVIDFISSFIGEKSAFKFIEMVQKIRKSSSEPLSDDDVLNRIQTLISMNFMGVKINGSPAIYAYDVQESSKTASIVRNVSLNGKAVFIINPVFHKYLDININQPEGFWEKIKKVLSSN